MFCLLHGPDGEWRFAEIRRCNVHRLGANLSLCVQHQNFEEQMQGMKTQLIQLSTLLRLLDLAFWNYLGKKVYEGQLLVL